MVGYIPIEGLQLVRWWGMFLLMCPQYLFAAVWGVECILPVIGTGGLLVKHAPPNSNNDSYQRLQLSDGGFLEVRNRTIIKKLLRVGHDLPIMA
eukprot:3810032-Pyramimonas_sp.AAC.1